MKIDDLVKKMTLEEKAALCTGADAWTTTPIERLGVPKLTVSDGPHGVRRVTIANELGSESLPATCFPTASCSASTWNIDLIYEMGQALAEECIALKVDVILGPGVNMKRTPLCGRNFEYFSEDPYLAGEMAASFILGVQSKGVGACIKHFAANNQETRRLLYSAELDERTLREIYLPAFETAVKKAKPWSVMCAYNLVNGTYCPENHHLLTDILKDEWGFEGFVVSDWFAVHDRVASLKAGLDLEMPGPREMRVLSVVATVRSGEMEESILDDAVRRILGIILKVSETSKGAAYDQPAHHSLARRIASEGIVLLKNDGVLPLKANQRIAVIGRAAKIAYIQGVGSSHINPIQVDNPLDELRKIVEEAHLSFALGYSEDDNRSQSLIDEAVTNARQADVALLFIALPDNKEKEGHDRPDLDLTSQQVELINAVSKSQPKTVVILNNGSSVVMSKWIDGTAALLEAWMTGQAGAGAIVDVLFGKVNPSGKLAETFPIKLVDTPAYLNFPGANDEVCYGEGIFIGYRYYDAKEKPVQFPFGYGMSYTTFAYENPQVSSTTFKDVDGVTVSVDVTNTGKVTGKEIVQVYVHDHISQLIRPPKELKGFAKIELQPGETKTVIIPLDFRAFAYYHPAYRLWITEDGEYAILIGSSSADIRCIQTVTLQSSVELPCILSQRSTLRDWMEDTRGMRILSLYIKKLPTAVQEGFGGVKKDAIGMDTSSFIMDMPLPNRLHDFESYLPSSPEDLVEKMLADIYHGN